MHDLMWKESVNALPKVVSFLRVLRFLPQGMLTGWVGISPLTDWPFHRSYAPWSDTSHKAAAIGALIESLQLDQVDLRPL
jgi:hypothetical protein